MNFNLGRKLEGLATLEVDPMYIPGRSNTCSIGVFLSYICSMLFSFCLVEEEEGGSRELEEEEVVVAAVEVNGSSIAIARDDLFLVDFAFAMGLEVLVERVDCSRLVW